MRQSFGISSKVALSFFLITGSALAGELRLIDGDGFHLDGEPVRLWGIDAPELDQSCERDGKRYACGERAREALADLVRRGRVECREVDRDRHGRSVARCSVEGLDLGGELVRRGWALDYERYSGGSYAGQEAEARRVGRGLWGGEFVSPWEWRRQGR